MVENKAKNYSGDSVEKEPVKCEKLSPEDVLRTVVYMQEAIINVLEKKGIADRTEIMDEVRNLVKSHKQ